MSAVVPTTIRHPKGMSDQAKMIGDGYECMQRLKGWALMASRPDEAGYDLGDWPLVFYAIRRNNYVGGAHGRPLFEVLEYVEGDITIYGFAAEADWEAFKSSELGAAVLDWFGIALPEEEDADG